ncbi:hypothetical protein HK096_001814 [Nowakowskiella sp. JEL0078]|nr:hypothetical protein HK096_001814 [Nowakowskiella sp. JEL0078]
MAKKKVSRKSFNKQSSSNDFDEEVNFTSKNSRQKNSDFIDLDIDRDSVDNDSNADDDDNDDLVEVLSINSDDSEDEDDFEDPDETLLHKLQSEQMRLDDDELDLERLKKRRSDRNDTIDDGAWGSSKRMYYNGDDVSDEEEDAKDEEKEALRLQKKQRSIVREEDYLDETFSSRLQKPVNTNSSQIFTITDITEESINRDELKTQLESMSDMEAKRLVNQVAPEIVALLNEFAITWDEVSTKIQPTVAALRKLAIIRQESEDVSRVREFLELKYELFTSYLTNISFYLALCSNPSLTPAGTMSYVKSHPVLETLVTIKEQITRLEEIVEGKTKKINGLSKKKKKQMTNEQNGFVELMALTSYILEAVAEDRLDDLLPDHTDEDEMIIEQSEKEASSEPELQKPKKGKKTTNKKSSKDDLKKFKIEIPDFVPIKTKKTKTVKMVQNDFEDPETLDPIDAIEKAERLRSLKYSVTSGNELSKKRKQIFAGDQDLPYKDKFGKVIESKYQQTATPEPILASKKRKSDTYHDLDNESVGMNDLEDIKLDSIDLKKFNIDVPETNKSEDDGLSIYENIVNAKKRKKFEREEMISQLKAESEDINRFDENEDPTDKRKASWNILANKGLTPKRRKEVRNPRVKHRMKYDSALKKLSSVRAVAKDKKTLGAYSGEKTGIRADITKSIKF